MASGIAFLETAANLYVTVLGDPKKGDFRLNLAQSFNGMSIILGPIIGGLFIFSEKEYTREMIQALPAAEAEATADLCRRRPVGPARNAPHVCRGDLAGPQGGGGRGAADRDVALPWCLARIRTARNRAGRAIESRDC